MEFFMPFVTLLKFSEQFSENPGFIGDTGVVILSKLLVGDVLPMPLAKIGVDGKDPNLKGETGDELELLIGVQSLEDKTLGLVNELPRPLAQTGVYGKETLLEKALENLLVQPN